MLVLGVLCYFWMMTGFRSPRRSVEIYWRDQFRARSNSLLLHTGLLLTPQSSKVVSLLLGRHLIITGCGVPLTYSVIGRVLVSSLEKVSICVPHLDFTEEGRSGPQLFFFFFFIPPDIWLESSASSLIVSVFLDPPFLVF